jgi:NAD-dependent DNA ligase
VAKFSRRLGCLKERTLPREFWTELVRLYYTASYDYYILDKDSDISDKYFDDICRRLSEDWEVIPTDIRQFLDREELSAGSGYTIDEERYSKFLSFVNKEK